MFAPMEIGWVPVSWALSDIIAVAWIEVGGRVGKGADAWGRADDIFCAIGFALCLDDGCLAKIWISLGSCLLVWI